MIDTEKNEVWHDVIDLQVWKMTSITDECFENDSDNRYMNSADIEGLITEVKELQDKITLMEMQYVGLEQAYYNSPAEIENKRLRELLVEAAHCIHEMEGMAYAEADPDDLAKHAKEFRGNVSTTIGDDAPWGDEE